LPSSSTSFSKAGMRTPNIFFLMGVITIFARKNPPMPVKPVCSNVKRVPPGVGSSL
jgi:hypothetical protein